MSEKTLIILRGLPSSGKSTRARELAGSTGKIYSTDEYWYKVRHPDAPDVYSFNPNYLADAHHWNRQRTFRSIELGEPLIIIDNTNIALWQVYPYGSYALPQDYKLRLEEPTTEWWSEIRELLKHKHANEVALKEWAIKLAHKSSHGVPAWGIERMMWKYEHYTEEQMIDCCSQFTFPIEVSTKFPVSLTRSPT